MKTSLVAGLIACTGLFGCASSQDEPTREEIMEKGQYCCTHDGESTTPACDKSAAGGIYLQDFSDVDASGRGDACGWILK